MLLSSARGRNTSFSGMEREKWKINGTRRWYSQLSSELRLFKDRKMFPSLDLSTSLVITQRRQIARRYAGDLNPDPCFASTNTRKHLRAHTPVDRHKRRVRFPSKLSTFINFTCCLLRRKSETGFKEITSCRQITDTRIDLLERKRQFVMTQPSRDGDSACAPRNWVEKVRFR